jgi:hypothetical protein
MLQGLIAPAPSSKSWLKGEPLERINSRGLIWVDSFNAGTYRFLTTNIHSMSSRLDRF